jgi:hypothetical protein
MMTDIEALLRTYLTTSSEATDPLIALAGDRVWAGNDTPPEYRPVPDPDDDNTGPGVLITLTPGEIQNGIIGRPLVRFQCLGKDEAEVRLLRDALHAALEGRGFQKIRRIWLETVPNLVNDQERDRIYVESSYRVIAVMI